MNVIDETGKIFGNLTVLDTAGVCKSGNRKWKCRCTCGDICEVSGSQLRGSKNRPAQTKCVKCRDIEFSERGIAIRTPDTIYRSLLYRYKSRANVKGLPFHLSLEDVRSLTSSNCHYCGIGPVATYRKHSQSIKYTGLDRRDNREGYTISNVVPCCKQCNQSKMDYSEEDFMSWVKRTYEHLWNK
jgi:hypothetical protein